MPNATTLAAQLRAATDEIERNRVIWALVEAAQAGTAEERAAALGLLNEHYRPRLVEPMASRFATRGTMRWDDFVQQGWCGLLDAVGAAEAQNSDVSFEAYAKPFVLHEMVALRGGETPLESTYQERNWKPVRRARDRFLAREGRKPTVEELVEEVNRERGLNDRLGPRTVEAILRAENPWLPVYPDRPTEADAPGGHIPSAWLDGSERDEDGPLAEVPDEPFRQNASMLSGRFEFIRRRLGEDKGGSYVVMAVLLSVTEEVDTYESLREHLVEKAPRFAGRPLGFDQELVTWSLCHAKLALPEWVPSRWSAVQSLFTKGADRVIGAAALGARFRAAEQRLLLRDH